MAASMWAFMLSWFTPTSLFVFVNLMIGTILLSSRFGTHKKPLQQRQQEQLVRVPSLLDRARSINFSQHKFQQPNLEPEALQPTEPEYVASQHANPDNSTGLTRTPSFLDRVRSINFSHYIFEQHNPEHEALRPTEPEYVPPQHVNPDSSIGLTRTASLLDRLKSMDFSFYKHEQPDPETKYIDPEESEREVHDRIPRRENLVHRSKSEKGRGAPLHEHEKIKKSVSEKLPLGGGEGDDAIEKRRPATAKVEKTLSFGGDEEVDAKADDFINRFKQQLKLQRLESLLRYREMLKRN